jgi:phospholipase C
MNCVKTLFASRVAAIVALAALAITLSGCRGLVSASTTPASQQGLQNINHIIFMAQENRGFEHYFGSMRPYWKANGYPDQAFDGLPQFNPASGMAPLRGPIPTNPGCDPAFPFDPTSPFPQPDCMIDSNNPIQSFHAVSMCLENPSPSWNEAHVDMNYLDPTMSHTPNANAPMDGFVWTSGHDARNQNPPFSDTNGVRAMAYYDGGDLPYYYFMASNFGTSDRWFSPAMTRTQPNRMYMLAATSAGHAYPIPPGGPVLTVPTIFDLLQNAGVSWKIYVTDLTYATPPVQDSSLNMFATAAKYPQNIFPVSQFMTDVKNGTLPSVAYIEPGLASGLDEHPGLDDGNPGANIQAGAQYVSGLVNALMTSPSWNDSVFILTFDEYGGFFDHVPPQTGAVGVSPDGIPPQDLAPGPPPNGPDVCVNNAGPSCDFVYTGYRVPLMVISPFAKRNYVSHTVTDYTAWLKLVETRFNLPSLTKRDAAQIDMTEFFDFTTVPWKTPPVPPVQNVTGPCYLDHLP